MALSAIFDLLKEAGGAIFNGRNTASNWSLSVEDPYAPGTHGPQKPATVTKASVEALAIELDFTYNGTAHTVSGKPAVHAEAINVDGTDEPSAHLVNAGFPGDLHFDFRPVRLKGIDHDVRLNFRYKSI